MTSAHPEILAMTGITPHSYESNGKKCKCTETRMKKLNQSSYFTFAWRPVILHSLCIIRRLFPLAITGTAAGSYYRITLITKV